MPKPALGAIELSVGEKIFCEGLFGEPDCRRRSGEGKDIGLDSLSVLMPVDPAGESSPPWGSGYRKTIRTEV